MIAAFGSLLLIASTAAAAADGHQPKAASAQAGYSAQMQPLAPLVGEWKGKGWILLPDGSRATFSSHEKVTRKLSGNALLIEGQHRDAAGAMVHDALAMLTWDPRGKTHRMRSALANGNGGDFPLTLKPGGFTWVIDMPSGRVEYDARFDGDSWTETGARIAADGSRTPFFEMELEKVD